LSVIVGFANKNNPGEPIYIRKTTLSGYIGRSLPQLRRYLADLEADGWIERHQHISRDAGAQVGSITLTAKCIAAFFSKEQPAAKATSRPTASGSARQVGGDEKPSAQAHRRSVVSDSAHAQRRSGVSVASIGTPVTNINLRGNPPARAHAHEDGKEGGVNRLVENQNSKQPEPPTPQTTQPTAGTDPARERKDKEPIDRVPTELRWLCSKGISPFGVFGLMAKAKAAGTTLQQVLRCLSLSSGFASVKNLYAYINQVLARPRDWNRIERNVQAIQPEKLLARQRAEEEAMRKKETAHLNNMLFHEPKTGIWYKVLGPVAMMFHSEEDLRIFRARGGLPVRQILDMIKTGDVIPAPLANA
jgi:hypothetical protein